MGIKFSNNASANIIQALTPTATSVSVTPDKGDLFPSLLEGDYFYATLAGNNGLEIVKVTNRVKDTMTIVRAQDNTIALSFDTGDLFELRIVAAAFNDTFSEVNDKLEASIEENTSIVNYALSSKAPILHASSSTEYGAGTSALYGHLKSHDEPDSTLTADSGHAFSPAGAAAIQEALGETQEVVSELDSTLRAFIAEEVAKYLPLAGGVMTGALEFDRAYGHIIKSDNKGRMVIRGGAVAPDAGASVHLFGADHPDSPGRLLLQSVTPDGGLLSLDLANGKALIGDKNVVRSVNGVSADAAGNVALNAVLPTGTVVAFAASKAPSGGFLLCNGSNVSRTTYSALFSVIGTTYGTGDGSTTFTLPNLTDKFIQGSGTAGTVKKAGMPNISGRCTTDGFGRGNSQASASGPFYFTQHKSEYGSENDKSYTNPWLNFDASRVNSIYGASSTVQPPAITMRYYIKY